MGRHDVSWPSPEPLATEVEMTEGAKTDLVDVTKPGQHSKFFSSQSD